MNVNQERIKQLQQEMKAAGMDMYLVPTADFHILRFVPGCLDFPVLQELCW